MDLKDLGEEEFLRCCGSRRWARAMAEARPFPDLASLLESARSAWRRLEPVDWLEAFSHHPRIGDKKPSSAWASQEQAGVKTAQKKILDEIAEGNRAYEKKFGFVFLICATGKSAQDMLAALSERLKGDPASELARAAGEQEKITEIRLRKLLGLEL